MNWDNLELPENPYYQDDAVLIYNADCREILPDLPKVDLVLTDPPYGIGYVADGFEKWNDKHLSAPVKSLEPIVGDDGTLDLGWLYEYPRWVVWGFPYLYNADASGWLVWRKHADNEPKAPMSSPVEMAMSNVWSGFKLVEAIWVGYMRDAGEYRFEHPTQKPIKVIDRCVNLASAIGDLILDPFLGSGTTAYCAKKLNRKCIGIEIEERYCEIAANRCRQEVMELKV
jgi:site-specific DNA-methyltransferase (adenine-specific)